MKTNLRIGLKWIRRAAGTDVGRLHYAEPSILSSDLLRQALPPVAPSNEFRSLLGADLQRRSAELATQRSRPIRLRTILPGVAGAAALGLIGAAFVAWRIKGPDIVDGLHDRNWLPQAFGH